MKLYLAAGQYVGTQVEARKLEKNFNACDVPTDKDGLIAHLNALMRVKQEEAADLVFTTLTGETTRFAGAPRPMDATAVLSRSDNQGVDVDAIIEIIGKANGYALKRYAGAVAVAFHALEN